ncbi:MAG: recombinase family protein [Clostridia bacterium]|nr:recombinase family protein [Clostridia bacterium]
MDNTQKTAGYIRTEYPFDEYGDVDMQKHAIESMARDKGLELSDVYVDRAAESFSLNRREGFSRLNEDILSGKVNTVITFNMDSFTNDIREKHGLMHEFAEKGVEIYLASTDEHINPSDPITREQRLLSEAMRDTEDMKADMVTQRRRNEGQVH